MQRRVRFRILGAGLMLGLWLVLLGLSSSHSLHRRLHADAGHVSHDCLVKCLGKCAEFPPPAGAFAAPVFFQGKVCDLSPLELPALADVRLPATRGPPSVRISPVPPS